MSAPAFLGKQYFIELYKCDKILLDDVEELKRIMTSAALAAQATIVKEYYHKFTPQGISGTIVIAESHFNIHTWPEYGYAAVDLFTCGEELQPQRALEVFARELQAGHYRFETVLRGRDIQNFIG